MICYVILHYQNIEVTQECVEKLKRIIQKESKIVVIDNASPNGSGEKLLNYFASDGMVKLSSPKSIEKKTDFKFRCI